MSGHRSRARRRPELSQHFLKSRALAASLVAQSAIGARDLVVEIGAGQGLLTLELARSARHVVAVEFDGQLYRELRARFHADPKVTPVRQDFLRLPPPTEPYKVFGNIPFNRTAEIVRHLVDSARPPEDAYLVVQREAAERFAGYPYAHETLMSLSVKPWWHVEIVHRLRRTDLHPPPSVETVLLCLARRVKPLMAPSDELRYREFVERSFGQGGDTVRRSLHWALTPPQVSRLARDLRFDVSAPPSALTFDQWLGVFRFFVTSHG